MVNIIGLLLVVLKLTGHIGMSWFWVIVLVLIFGTSSVVIKK